MISATKILFLVFFLKNAGYGSGNAGYVRLFPNNGNCVEQAADLNGMINAPEEIWRLKIGEGKSAVIETGGKAYTGFQSEGKQWAVCLDPATGKIIWKKMLLAKENHHGVDGMVATPIADGERIYFIPYDSNNGDLWDPHCPVFCLNRNDGSVIWKEDDLFTVSEGCLPLIKGNILYIGSSGKGNVLVAVDKNTGRLLWKTAHDSGAKHCFQTGASLAYAEFCGIPQVICSVYNNDYIGVDAESGRVLWKWKFPTPPFSGPVPTPVVTGNRLLLSTFQNEASWGACLGFAIKNGQIEPRVVYMSDKLMCNAYKTPSVLDGAVYTFGMGTSREALQCIDLASGKLLWQDEGGGWTRRCNMTVAGGFIFSTTRSDEIVIAEAVKTGYRERYRINPGIRLGLPQQPVVFGQRMYIRGNDEIVCYDLKGK